MSAGSWWPLELWVPFALGKTCTERSSLPGRQDLRAVGLCVPSGQRGFEARTPKLFTRSESPELAARTTPHRLDVPSCRVLLVSPFWLLDLHLRCRAEALQSCAHLELRLGRCRRSFAVRHQTRPSWISEASHGPRQVVGASVTIEFALHII